MNEKGIVIKNTNLHPNSSLIQPPICGPNAAAQVAITPVKIATICCSF